MPLRFRQFLLLLTLTAAPCWAVGSTPITLGNDGTLYRLKTGGIGEVFGPDATYPPNTPVAVLEVVPPGQPQARFLVPGTEGMETESSPVLLADSRTNTVHAIWSSRSTGNLTTSRLRLRSFSSGDWSSITDLSGASMSEMGSLHAALTEDSYSTTIDDVETRVARRVLHLAWTEEHAGAVRTYYAPAFFLNGAYVGWNPVIDLDSVVPGAPVAEAGTPVGSGPELTLMATPADRLRISFTHSQSGRLVSVEVQSLPGELGELAEMARGSIVDLAAVLGDGDRTQLSEMARGSIVDLAGRFNSSVAGYFGSRTRDSLLAADSSADVSTLAELARGSIVDLGREILKGGVASPCADEDQVIEIPSLFPVDGADFSQFLVVRSIASWALPADFQSTDRVIMSLDGSRAAIAWEAEGYLSYRETQDDGTWSEARSLDLTVLTLAEAWSAIERRALGF